MNLSCTEHKKFGQFNSIRLIKTVIISIYYPFKDVEFYGSIISISLSPTYILGGELANKAIITI